MVLDNINESTTSTNMDLDMPSRPDTSMSYGQELPKPKPTMATQIYKIKKQIEDSVARCRTLAGLTSDITVLDEALVHCQAACNKLATAATTKQDHGPPIVTAIENAGIEEFKGKAKFSHRVGMKHRVHRRRESLNYSQDPLLKRPSTRVGHPKIKRPQRKLRTFPRQTSCSNRTKILNATRLLQKDEYTLALIKTILIQLHYYSTTDSSQASITEESYSRGIDGGKHSNEVNTLVPQIYTRYRAG